LECPLIVGHRCNSVRTAILYRLLNVDSVEVDVRLGSGGEVIVGHGAPWMVRPTPLGRLIAALDYRLFSRDPLIARRRRLSRWLSTLTWVKHFLLDLKDPVEPGALAAEVARGSRPGSEIAIATPRHRDIPGLKQALPHSTVLATLRDWIADPVRYLESIEADGASIPLPLALEGYADALREVGFKVYVWTLNDAGQIRAAASAADAIITDAPWRARAALRRLCRSG